MKLEKDTRVSRYKILSEIGKGGMGEVYLAEDTELDRKVAIKFLSEEFSQDSDKLNRFIQEAKAASALNHPNIITIYEIGKTDETRYIALEYIDGETLTTRLKQELKFDTALDIATQIASALDAAHSAGIVHRDIKPDNVMIRNDGIVKILDFGIAKLTEQQKPEAESEDKTAVQVNTTPGMIIGTANYMSPEQAKGKEVDSRTDIFSFGVLLYEMVSGGLPFEGGTPMESISAILKDDPRPLHEDVPAEVVRVISKTLRKDRGERYQTIKDVLIDLKDAKEDLRFQDKFDKTAQPDRTESETQMFKATTAAEQQQTANITGETKGSLPKWLMASGVIGLVGVAVFAGWYFLAEELFSKETPFAKIKVEEITSTSNIVSPVISADGKFIAYVKSALNLYAAKKSLVVRQTGSGAENVIFEVPKGGLRLKTFSADGEFIYFTREARGNESGFYKISTLGRSPKKILDGDFQEALVSPDGKKIAYQKMKVIYLADIDGSNSIEILKLQDIDADNMELKPWHPDGTRLLIEIFKNIDSKGLQGSVATLDVSNNDVSPKDRVQIFYDEMWVNYRELAWTPDGNGIISLIWKAPEPMSNHFWYLSYPEGKIRQVTDDFNNYQEFSLSADGKSIIGTTRDFPASLWSVDPESKKVRQVILENKDLDGFSISSTKNGKVYYFKHLKTGSVIYSNSPEGGAEKELFTIPGRIGGFKIDNEGKYIVASNFVSKLPSDDLVRFDIDGSNRTQLTNIEFVRDRQPQITNEGFVLFDRSYYASDKPTEIMKIPMTGGEAEKIDLGPSDGDFSPSLSPDGKYLAYLKRIEDKTSGETKSFIRVVEFGDGKAGKLVLEKEFDVPRIRWTPESDAIIYEKPADGSNLFKLTLSGQTETQITDFNLKADTADFTWTPDGRSILAFRSTSSANLVLIKDVTTEGN